MKFFKRLLFSVLTLAFVLLPVFVWLQRYAIYDWWWLRNYTPSSEIAALADNTTMTSEARRLFYANRPVIASESEFNQNCSREASIVLGCYIPGKGIFIYRVTDDRLSGVREVTAAHEMLHVAYERLSSKDRHRVDTLTSQALEGLTNERIVDTIRQYRKQDASIVPNELHSIMATEVRHLPSELEVYYSRYFTDRAAVVSFSEQYEAEFERRRSEVAELDNRLSSFRVEVDSAQADLEAEYRALMAEKQRIDTLSRNGDSAVYNAAVPSFNRRVSDYNSSVRHVDNLINQYNSLVSQRNEKTVEMQDLVEAIDSRPRSF